MTPHCKHSPQPFPEPGPYVPGECRLCWLAVNHPNGNNLLAHETAPTFPVVNYVINMKRRDDRRRHMTEQFGKAGLPFEYVEAVDGRTVPLPPGWKSGAGAYGCYRSHMITLERAMSAGHKCIAVYEDDVEFVDDYANKLSTLLVQVSSLDANWQAVFPGGQHMTHPVETSEHNVIRGINVHRTHAYIVRGSYIQELYNLWNGSDKHIDHTWGEAQKGKRVYCPRKWLAAQSAGHSDINGRNLNQRFWTPRRVMPCGGCGKGNPNAFRRQQERARANLNTAPNRRPR